MMIEEQLNFKWAYEAQGDDWGAKMHEEYRTTRSAHTGHVWPESIRSIVWLVNTDATVVRWDYGYIPRIEISTDPQVWSVFEWASFWLKVSHDLIVLRRLHKEAHAQ